MGILNKGGLLMMIIILQENIINNHATFDLVNFRI